MRLRGCSFSGVAKDTSLVLWYTENVGKGTMAAQVHLRMECSFCLLPGPPAAASKSQSKDLSASDTFSWRQPASVIGQHGRTSALTICPQPEQFWRAIAAPCGISGGLHRSCTTLQLLPPPSPASPPLRRCCFWIHSRWASSTHSSETSSLFPEMWPMMKAK